MFKSIFKAISKGNIFTILISFVVIWWFVLPAISKFFSSAYKSGSNKIDSMSALSKLALKGIYPSYSSLWYSQSADSLYMMMAGAGTDSVGVFEIFKQLKNDADFVSLTDAFGIRDGYSLSSWIHGDFEYNTSHIWFTNYDIKDLNQILKNNNITYKF